MMHAPFFPFMLHAFFCGLLCFGVLLLFVWLAKFATKSQLKKWIVWLFIFGILGSIGSMIWGKNIMDTAVKNGSGYTMMRGNFEKGNAMRPMHNWNNY